MMWEICEEYAVTNDQLIHKQILRGTKESPKHNNETFAGVSSFINLL